MITYANIETVMYEAMRRAATTLPPEVERALQRVRVEETDPLARQQLDVSFENLWLAAQGSGPLCGDTGFPLFVVTAGANTQIEGGFGRLWDAARAATARLTDANFLRPTMVDPLTRNKPGNSVPGGIPKVELVFSGQSNGLHLVAAPRGGGSEIFGTFYRMLFPSDGEAGIMEFVIGCIRAGCYAGKICPPAILGVGIGGTGDLCMSLAKEAAVLRPVGKHHSNPRIAELERNLLAATRKLKIGPMGSCGINLVLGLNIETAVTHTDALPVAVNAQCLIGCRWTATIDADNTVTYSGNIS